MASGIFSPEYAMQNVIRDAQARAEAVNSKAVVSYAQAAKDWQDAYVRTGGKNGPPPIPLLAQHVDSAGVTTSGPDMVCPIVQTPVVNFMPSSGIIAGAPAADRIDQIQQTLNWHSQMLMEIGRLLSQPR